MPSMLTDPKLRSQVDALWDKFWKGGLANPLDAIEQFSYFRTPSRRFCARPYALPCNLRDGVLAGVVARVESLRARMSEAGRQVEGLFESLLSEAFG